MVASRTLLLSPSHPFLPLAEFDEYGRAASGSTENGRVLGGIVDRMLRHEFERDERDVVVAFGDGSFACKGRFRGPVKTVRRELEKRVAIGTGPGGVVEGSSVWR